MRAPNSTPDVAPHLRIQLRQRISRFADRSYGGGTRAAPWAAAPPPLQPLRRAQEGADAREQAAGGAAVEDAVVEGEGDVSFGDRQELLLLLVPIRDDAAGAHAEDEGLLGEGDGR